MRRRSHAQVRGAAAPRLRTPAREFARAGVQLRDDLRGAPCLFHLRHARTRGASPKHPRHFILFRFDEHRIYILRVLHDAMDIERRVSDEESEA